MLGMKKERQPKSVLVKLPFDVIVKIVFYVGDAKDLMAFLDALRPWNVLGPLDHLYQLCQTQIHSNLWPALRLDAWIVSSPYSASFEAIAKYYSNVVVEHNWRNVEWLKTHLHPIANIEWITKKYPEKIKKFDEWTELRITRLRTHLNLTKPSTWKTLLPRLPYLQSLSVDSTDHVLEDLFECVATSNQITELQILPNNYRLTAANVVHLTEWFNRQPVQTFDCSSTGVGDSPPEVLQAFYQTVLNCRTLDKLKLSYCYLDDWDFSKWNFTMPSLDLSYCVFNSRSVQALASQLEGSSVTHLALNPCNEDNVVGIECLVQGLSRTSIKHLKLDGMFLNSQSFCHFATQFEHCTLETLVLGTQQFPSDVASVFAGAIQKNQTICQVDLDLCEISIPDLERLIRSISHRSRPVKIKRIILKTPMERSMQSMTTSTVQSLTNLAVECGAEFVHSYVLK
ncbi:hypothetical protein AeRB84_006266 [Aphanomyces euteiches]|nr:hypothetical protein AeRB84_006266 [Aphanomyces euteiches]